MFELKMPKLGESVTEGTIGKWLKKPGDKVNKYDLLVEVQTDEVNTEIPSPVAGTLREVKVEEGQTVPIGTLLATFDTADETAAASPAAGQATTSAAAEAPGPRASQPASPQAPSRPAPMAPSSAPRPAAPTAAPASAAAYASARPGGGNGQAARADLSEVRATPAVRKLASESGVDISEIEGTGLGGRVSRKDVEDFIAQRSAQPQQTAAQQAAPRAAEAQSAPRSTAQQQA